MVLLLEEMLKNADSGLYSRLIRVQESATQIWSTPRLIWFTDHSVKHSKRIVEILGHLISDLQNTRQELIPEELYILLAASYLHDIGMQDYNIDGRGIENFSAKDYELIRRTHPIRGAQLILDRTIMHSRQQFQINLDDQPPYTVAISLVSKGHGSEYFDSVLGEFRTLPHRPNGKSIRGNLLTALLMLADELDLHEDRATFPSEMSLSSVSSLHHHVHHYIANLEILTGNTRKEKKIRITFNYPKNSNSYSRLVRDWIVSKLQKQIRRVSDIINLATDGELILSPKIEIRETFDQYGQRRDLPEEARKELVRQISKLETINYDSHLGIISDVAFRGEPNQGLLVIAENEINLAHTMKWLDAQCFSFSVPLLIINLKHEPYNPTDIIVEINNWIDQQSVSPTFKRGVLVIQHVDSGDQETKNWIASQIETELTAKAIPLSIIITCCNKPSQLTSLNTFWKELLFDKMSYATIATYLNVNLGFSIDKAKEKAQEIYGTSQGETEGIIYAINNIRSKDQEVIE